MFNSRPHGVKLASHVNENLSGDIKPGLAGPAEGWNPGGPQFVGGESCVTTPKTAVKQT